MINSAETEDLKLMVQNLWWELVINISKFLTLSAFPTCSLTLPAVITVGMLKRDKTDSLTKEVFVPESTGLFIHGVKLIGQFPNLFGNFN